MTKTETVLLYLVAINIIGFLSMAIDKKKAIRGAWRIPEARLFGYALLGGSLGSLCGMYTFRHKTKHSKFVLGIPAILVLQVVAAALLLSGAL